MTPPLSTEHVAKALAEVIREALIRNEKVDVHGLGTFEVTHHSSREEEAPDGRLLLQPPRDVVDFSPAA